MSSVVYAMAAMPARNIAAALRGDFGLNMHTQWSLNAEGPSRYASQVCAREFVPTGVANEIVTAHRCEAG
jgi:hypothetical protein